MQVERPQEINDQIDKLLKSGTVEELRSQRGRFLRLFFSADEVSRAMSLPMGDPPDFDGISCGLCRGDMRFSQCGKCRGSFDNLPQQKEVISSRIQAQKRAARKNIGIVRAFWDRLAGHDASY